MTARRFTRGAAVLGLAAPLLFACGGGSSAPPAQLALALAAMSGVYGT